MNWVEAVGVLLICVARRKEKKGMQTAGATGEQTAREPAVPSGAEMLLCCFKSSFICSFLSSSSSQALTRHHGVALFGYVKNKK